MLEVEFDPELDWKNVEAELGFQI